MNFIALIFLTLVSIGIYFIPSFVAWKKKQYNAIFLLNLFLGWTIVGWVGALVWASIKEDKKEEK